MPDTYLTVTIDTEEDNWGEYDRAEFSVGNVERIPRLQELFEAHGVRPTYLITYPIATSPRAVEVLGRYVESGRCEIGTHLHPWNTPPIEEARTAANSFVDRLPRSLQFRKLSTLHDTIAASFGAAPTSYRSGRWGFNEEIARHLIRLRYRVDTSISPAIDWREYGGPDYSKATCQPFVYRTGSKGDSDGGLLLEVPATVDFLQPRRLGASAAYRAIKGRLPFGGRVIGALDRLRVLNRVSLSPELDDASRMIRLSRALMRRGARVLNVFFHSPSLLEGCSPYARTPSESNALFGRIEEYLTFAHSAGLVPAALSDLTPSLVRASSVKVLRAATSIE